MKTDICMFFFMVVCNFLYKGWGHYFCGDDLDSCVGYLNKRTYLIIDNL